MERGIEIAGLPILARGVLEGLAERLGCTRHEAAKFWASILATTLPFTHQRQAAIEVRPPGAPGSGQPILWEVTDDGQLIDMSHSDGEETLRNITPPPARLQARRGEHAISRADYPADLSTGCVAPMKRGTENH